MTNMLLTLGSQGSQELLKKSKATAFQYIYIYSTPMILCFSGEPEVEMVNV